MYVREVPKKYETLQKLLFLTSNNTYNTKNVFLT